METPAGNMLTRSYRRPASKRLRPHLYHGPRRRNREGKKMLDTPYYWWMEADLDVRKVRAHQRRLAGPYAHPLGGRR